MRTGLESLSVLIIEDDEDSGELLADALRSHGATVRVVGSGANALRELALQPPDVMLCDLGLPDGSGLDWIKRFRAVLGMRAVPAIALSGYGTVEDRARSLAAGFEKHLLKPARLIDIVSAVATLGRTIGPAALRPILTQLAELTGCRFTSLLRFDGDALISLWTHDRAQPGLDPFPLDLPIEASYCVLVRQSGAPITIEDAAHDPRAAGHPKQRELATYVAAPLFHASGEMFGTLCSYDADPRAIDADARAAVVAAARQLEKALRLSPSPGPA